MYSIAQIITLAFVIGAFALGRYSGYHNGFVAGRKAVRKHYENLIAVERKINETTNYQLIQAHKDQA